MRGIRGLTKECLWRAVRGLGIKLFTMPISCSKGPKRVVLKMYVVEIEKQMIINNLTNTIEYDGGKCLCFVVHRKR
jgi:hypothetical protein